MINKYDTDWLYNTILKLFKKDKFLRHNTKALMWLVWKKQGVISNSFSITDVGFKNAYHPLTIARQAQYVKKFNPTLKKIN